MKTPTAKEPSKGIREARSQGAARKDKWFLSRPMLVNFGVLVALFTAVLLIQQLGQKFKNRADTSSVNEVTAQVEPSPPEVLIAKRNPAQKFVASKKIALDSLAQKKKSVAWGDFIPFEKKR